MATKSKNSENRKRKKREPGFWVAVFLILAADVVFLFRYPDFQKRASAEEPDVLSGSEFLHEVYQANTVLYRQLCESIEGESLSGRYVYLAADDQKAEDVPEYYD